MCALLAATGVYLMATNNFFNSENRTNGYAAEWTGQELRLLEDDYPYCVAQALRPAYRGYTDLQDARSGAQGNAAEDDFVARLHRAEDCL